MADAQFQVINTSGTILIDSTYRNVALLSKGTGTAPAPGEGEFIAYNGSTWYRFGPPGTPSNYGLVIYTSSGQVAFDAAQKYARVVDIITGTSVTTGLGSRTYTAGRTYATVILKRGHTAKTVISPAPGGYYTYHFHFTELTATVSGATVTIGNQSFDDGERPPTMTPPNKNIDWGGWVVAVIDVTGY